MENLNTKEKIVLNAINQSKGKFFTVEFKKRTNGEDRTMLCRTGVSKGVTGSGLRFNPLDRGLQVVWDCHKNSYRMISLDSVSKIKVNKLKIKFE
jgi:hypothetical protein|tara:strand:- start:11367 stop:11651 length:285 start_codon:yes stop_codon:yes gene_type:complete